MSCRPGLRRARDREVRHLSAICGNSSAVIGVMVMDVTTSAAVADVVAVIAL